MNLPETTDVLIVGAGPVGMTLANLLGMEGINTVLIEQHGGIVPEPRAIAIDGESLRTLQAAGLIDTVLPTLRQGFIADYINGSGETLFKSDLTSKPYGFCLQNSFDQPTLERQLLNGLKSFPNVFPAFHTALENCIERPSGVRATLLSHEGALLELDARYLVACDGGRSTVRSLLNIEMQGDRLPQRWLVVDTVDRNPGDEPECRFFCDPRRPAMTLCRPAGERRWEWMLMDDESDDDMLTESRIRALLAEHTNPDLIDIYRKRVYGFSAVVAERFREGSVFLAGDAAHMTPPFAGQGLNAGVRDVRNLSWKLAAVIKKQLPPVLLDSYNLERHDAAKVMVDLACTLGDQIQPTDSEAAAERDAFFAQLNQDEAAAGQFSLDLLAPLHNVRLDKGWFGEGAVDGCLLPQPILADGTRLDDRLGAGFTALVRPGCTLPSGISEHALWKALTPSVLPAPAQVLSFMDLGAGDVLLLRPDRFVLACFPAAEASSAILDNLSTTITGATDY